MGADDWDPRTFAARPWLIAGALAFARGVTGRPGGAALPGVQRIALLGSILTRKSRPKDVDLLVTVADDAELEPLARLGRRLQGHAQRRNLGADIFLASPDGHYLGRICHWRECRPGIRMACDAWTCGRRPYLHDDFDDIRLPDELVSAPPLELWPVLLARVPVPADVQNGLIAPFGQDRPAGRDAHGATPPGPPRGN